MPYVRRNPEGAIVALLAAAAPDAAEFLPANDLQILAFLGSDREQAAFSALDADFVRVTEDLIYTLIDKGVLMFTDLPPDAQRKLLTRERFRKEGPGSALELPGLSPGT